MRNILEIKFKLNGTYYYRKIHKNYINFLISMYKIFNLESFLSYTKN